MNDVKIKLKKCMMYVNGKCNSEYRKGKSCDMSKCPYKNGGSFAMAIRDRPNWRKYE